MIFKGEGLTFPLIFFFFKCKILIMEVMLVKRKPIKKPAKDKRVFTNSAAKTKSINVSPKVYRGGIRL